MNAKVKVKNAIAAIGEGELQFKDEVTCGLSVTVVFPMKSGVITWTEENKYARSAMFCNDTGDIVSAGFPKFVNLGENVENFPVPTDLDECRIVEKMDGSLCMLDWINGQVNMRTRGTTSYKTLDNSVDFEVALAKYPWIELWLKLHPNTTLLCEIVSPNNRIVIDYPEIDFILIGAISKDTYNLMDQDGLDQLARGLMLPRPKRFSRFTLAKLSDLIAHIKDCKGYEGVCLYYPDGRIFKVKGDEYLMLHRYKTNATPKNLLRLYEENGFPSYAEMKTLIIADHDWECWKMAEGNLDEIFATHSKINTKIDSMQTYALERHDFNDREFAAVNNLDNLPRDRAIAFFARRGKNVPPRMIGQMLRRALKYND
jgi:hypothetical protein